MQCLIEEEQDHHVEEYRPYPLHSIQIEIQTVRDYGKAREQHARSGSGLESILVSRAWDVAIRRPLADGGSAPGVRKINCCIQGEPVDATNNDSLYSAQLTNEPRVMLD